MSDASPQQDEQHDPAGPSESPEGGGSADASDPLRLVLHTMEQQLDDRVGAVGDARPARDESTAELIRLEETLSSAQDKAKQLVTLRLKLGEEKASADRATEAASPEAAAPDASAADDVGGSKARDARPGSAQERDAPTD